MDSQALRHIHKLALRNRQFERHLVTNPRAVLQRKEISEAEISLVESFAPQDAVAFGLVIEEIERVLYDFEDNTDIFN